MVAQFLKGFFSFFSSTSKINKYGLKIYLLLSALISLAIGGLVIFIGMYFVYSYSGAMVATMLPFDIESEIVNKIISFVAIAIFLFLMYFIYKYLLWILLGPILSQISQKIELKLKGIKQSGSLLNLPKEITRGIVFASQCMIKEIFYTLLLLILGLFPFIGVISMPLLFLIQAYYIGLGNFDFYAERYFTIAQTKRIGGENKWVLIGIGTAFSLFIFIPFLGLIFSPILATIAATELAINNDIKNS